MIAREGTSLELTGTAWKHRGRAMVWLCGSALAFNLLLVLGILLLLLYNGAGAFRTRELVLLELDDGVQLLGEVHEREAKPPEVRSLGEATRAGPRIRLKVGNRDVGGQDFVWVDEQRIRKRSVPADAAVIERLEWGNVYGWPVEVRRARRDAGAEAPSGPELLAEGREAAWNQLLALLPAKHALLERIEALERGPIADLNHDIEELRRDERRIAQAGLPAAERDELLGVVAARLRQAQSRYDEAAAQLFALGEQAAAETVVVETAGGARTEFPVSQVVRAVRPNSLGTGEGVGLYLSRIAEFLADDPRESNTEGGIFPAIFGTVMMVFLMTLVVLPLGVLAAVYLREYAREGVVVRVVRIAVNNLAGVPSIVFGIFGLGFFVYLVGGTIDQLFYPESLPTPTFGTGGILWASLTLALLTLPVVIVATEEGLAAVPRALREGSLALGATKWETTWRVVLPAAAPGVLTGAILAMARAAGEVAPLMIVGMVKLAPALPVDCRFPFVHLDRKFMHLGFHIYDLGFQSPNVEATKPLVFATALFLVLLVLAMNLTAIAVRNHLRRKYASSSV